MKTRRLYSIKTIVTMFLNAGVHGGTKSTLWREGIFPITTKRGLPYYDADAVDSFVKMVEF